MMEHHQVHTPTTSVVCTTSPMVLCVLHHPCCCVYYITHGVVCTTSPMLLCVPHHPWCCCCVCRHCPTCDGGPHCSGDGCGCCYWWTYQYYCLWAGPGILTESPPLKCPKFLPVSVFNRSTREITVSTQTK